MTNLIRTIFSAKKSVSFLLAIFFILSVLVPVSISNKVVFILLILITIIKVLFKIFYERIYIISPIVIFYIFFYGFILSYTTYSDHFLSSQFMISVSVLFLIYLIDSYKINLDNMIKISGIILSIFILSSYFVLFKWQGTPYFELYYNFLAKYSQASWGYKEYFGDSGTLYFTLGAVSFLFLPFSLFLMSFLKKKSLLSFVSIIILAITIISSMTRGLIFSSICCVLLIFYFNTEKKKRLIILSLIIPIIIFGIFYLLTKTVLLSATEQSNSIKVGHIISFFENMDIKKFLIGDGLASYYYSSGVNKLTAHTEISPVDMFRYFGFFYALLLYLSLFFPSVQFRIYTRINKLYLAIFIIFIMYSFTNPVMFNSSGYMVVLWYWSKIIEQKKYKNFCYEKKIFHEAVAC